MAHNIKVLSAGSAGFCGIGNAESVITQASDLNEHVGTDCCLVLHGGLDIHPGWYSQTAHHTNQQRTEAQPIKRDVDEVLISRYAIELGIPIYAICRGAQLACVLAGGSLFQHFAPKNRPFGQEETLHLYDGGTITTNSYHHQLMDVEGTDHVLIGWTEYEADFYREGPDPVKGPDKQPEVVWFPSIKTLAIQSHPEWQEGSPFNDWVNGEFLNRISEVTCCG